MPWCSQVTTDPVATKASKIRNLMAKSEIPSIVVHSGGGGTNGCSDMDQHQSSRPSRLEKQEEFEMEEEGYIPSPVTIQIEDRGGGQDDGVDEGGGVQEAENGSKFEEANNGINERDIATDPCPHLLSGAQSNDGVEESKQDKSKVSSQRVKLLVRSQAVHDDASPPPDLEAVATNTNMLSVTNASSFSTQSQSKGSSNKNRLGRQGSSSQGSQGSTESSSGLSRDSSTETYTDSTGIDLQQFIIDTLHKNQKDRMMLLKIEQELTQLIKDNKRQSQKFGQMSSYNRMLVHRVAAFFGLDHYVDQNGTSVIVNKTKNTRIPDSRFQEYIRDELLPEEPKKSILKRDSISFEEGKEKSPERQSSTDSRRSKSFEEREEEYEKARARIFNQDEGLGESPLSRSQEGIHCSSRRSSQEDLRWTSSDARPWSSSDSDSSGRPLGAKGGSSFEVEGSVQSAPKSSRPVAVLSKVENENKELLLPTRMSRPAITKASSFGGISVLTRDVSSGKTATPKITKAESFNVTTISSSHPSPINVETTNPQPSTVSSPSPTNLVSSSVVHQTSTSSQFPATTGTAQQTFPMVAGQPTQLHIPIQQVSSQQIGWQSGNRDPSLTADYSSAHSGVGQQQPLVWPLSSTSDVMYPGSVILNPQAGGPYINLDNVLYRYKPPSNLSGQTIMLAPFQPLSVTPPNQVPISSHISVGAAVPPQTQQPPPHQAPQTPLQLQLPQPQQTMHVSQPPPTVVYIPYVPSQIQTPVTPQPSLGSCAAVQTVQQPSQPPPQPSQQQTQLLSDQRHYTLDPSSASMEELVAQMNNLTVVQTHLPSQPSQEASSAGRSILTIDPSSSPQSYVIPTYKSQGFVSQQGNVAQFPVYYMQQVQQASNVHPVRYVFPASSPAQQAAQGSNNSVGMGGQVVTDMQSHVVTQANSQVTGPQYVPGYPVLALSQSGDSSAPSSFISYTLASQTSAAITTTTSVLVPTSPMSVPVYPYANMVIGNLGNSSQTSFASPTTSQPTAQPPAYVQTPVAIQTPATLPMYVVTTSSAQTPVAQTGCSNVASQFASFRSQSLPSAPSSSAILNQQLGGGSPLVGYTLYAPPHMQAAIAQQSATPASALNQNPHTSQSSSQFTPTFLTAFQVLRPNIPVVGNVRTGTPPPQTMIPQYQTPPSSANKVPLSFPLVKQASDPGVDCFGLGNGNRAEQQKCSRAPQLQVVTSTACAPTSGLVCRRGIPIMQDLCLIGHPLQHHLNPLMLPQQRPLARFPPGSSNSSNRPPKTRKQRNKGNNASNSSGGRNGATGSSSQPTPDMMGNHILEIEGLPEGMKRSEVERYLEQVTSHGAKIQFLNAESGSLPTNGSDFVVSARHLVVAVFESDTAAQSALLGIKTSKFQLRQLRRGGKDGSLKKLS